MPAPLRAMWSSLPLREEGDDLGEDQESTAILSCEDASRADEPFIPPHAGRRRGDDDAAPPQRQLWLLRAGSAILASGLIAAASAAWCSGPWLKQTPSEAHPAMYTGIAPGVDWIWTKDASGHVYYYDPASGEASWVPPAVGAVSVLPNVGVAGEGILTSMPAPSPAPAPPPRPLPSCPTKEACLAAIDVFFDNQPRQDLPSVGDGLLRVRSSESLGGGPCGEMCDLPLGQGRFDTYDNAVAAIYFTKRGQLAKAQHVLDVFIRLLYPENLAGIDPAAIYDNLPSGRTLTLLAASYSSKALAQPGQYRGDAVIDGAVDTGNNAWAGLAFAHYAATAEAACYTVVAKDILKALSNAGACGDHLGGFLGRLEPYPNNYRSTEHNIDMAALARVLGDTEVQQSAELFVRSMYGRNTLFPPSYSMGTGQATRCDTSQPGDPVPADGTYWSILADTDPDKARITAALKFALMSPVPGGAETSGLWEEDVDIIWNGWPQPRLNGTRFSTWGHGVQWENTASAGMAMAHYQATYGGGEGFQLFRYIREVADSLRLLLGMYGGVPGSVLGGNMQAYAANDHHALYPGGSDTGIRYTYLRYLHVASTAWAGLFFLYQADPSQPVDEGANPFAVPRSPMPTAQDLACLPVQNLPAAQPPPAAAAQAGASCCAGPQPLLCCSTGGCCPTGDGIRLNCCSPP